jgi:hypothetical protein
VAVAAALMLASPEARAGTNPFKHPDPRWQITATGGYSLLRGYDGRNRRGGTAGLTALTQLTTGFSLFLDARWHMFSINEKAEDRKPTQAVDLKLMLRYDLDVLSIRPYLAAGGIGAIFMSGPMRDAEVGEDAPPSAVGWNLGPVIELGVDWRPVPLLAVGLVLDMCWLMRFQPPEGKQWPQIRTVRARVGLYF